MNVSQSKKNVSQKKLEAVKMEKMSKAINEFILDNNFLMEYVKNGVIEKIYDEREYYPDMINEVIENDLNAGYNGGYITDFITDAINTIPLTDKIHDYYKDDFIEIANNCN